MRSCFAVSGRLIKHQPISIHYIHFTFQVHDPGPQEPLGPGEGTPS